MITGFVGRLAKKQRRPSKNSGLNGHEVQFIYDSHISPSIISKVDLNTTKV